MGQLGTYDVKFKDKLTSIMNDKNIKNLNCKCNSTLIYKNNGDLLVFGSNVQVITTVDTNRHY